jgi:hypothetical protein
MSTMTANLAAIRKFNDMISVSFWAYRKHPNHLAVAPVNQIPYL